MVSLEDIIVPVIVGLIISVVMVVISRQVSSSDKTAERSIASAHNIEMIEDKVKDLKVSLESNREYIDKRVDHLVVELEKRGKQKDEDHRRLERGIEILKKFQFRSEWRIARLERSSGLHSGATGAPQEWSGSDENNENENHQ